MKPGGPFPVADKAVPNGIAFVIQRIGFPAYRMILLCCWLFSCSIDVLPSWKPDDGYSSLSSAELKTLSGNKDDSTGALLQVATVSSVKSLIGNHPGFTWFTVLSSWCPHALHDQQVLLQVSGEMDAMGVQLICLYTDFHPAYLGKRFLKQNSIVPLYFMEHQPEMHQEEKARLFIRGLDYGLPEFEGVPQHFLLDENGRLFYAQRGELHDPISVLKALASDGDLHLTRR